MNEAIRTQYLNALGIQQFVPRVLLPNSAALRECELPSVPEAENACVETSLLEATPEPRELPASAKAVNRLFEEPPSRSEKTRAKVKAEKDVSQEKLSDAAAKLVPPVEQKEKAAFSLAVWHLPKGLGVLDSHEARSALPTDKLLANILISSGLLSLNLPRAQHLRWPEVHSPQADTSWQAARDYLHSWLDASIQQQAITRWLIMGESALNAVVGPERASTIKCGDAFSLDAYSADVLYLPSLVELLREPARKYDVWRALIGFSSHIAS